MTTDEMIEVMARAMFDAGNKYAGLSWTDPTNSDVRKDVFRSDARAALAAILPVLREDIAAVVMAAPIGGRTRRVRARFDQIAKEIEG